MANQAQRWVVQELMRPIVLIGSVLSRLDGLILGRYHVRSSKKIENQFAEEIQQRLSFLFNEYNGKVVPDDSVKYPRPFDYASVIVALVDLRFRFFRGRGDLRAWVAPSFAPNDWEELTVVLNTLDASNRLEVKPILFWDDLATVLSPRMVQLKDAMSKPKYSDLKMRLSRIHNHERAEIRQWETEINRRLYPDQ